MRAGNLNKKVEIQNLGTTTNDFGEVEDGQWTLFKTVYANILPVSGKEGFMSNTDFAKTSHKIRVRFFNGLNASMRVVYDNRIFDILSVINVAERNKEYLIVATEGIND